MARVAGIVLTGGDCFKGGNITPAAGFNICADPEAAQVAFRSGLPPVVMPPDVPHKAPTPRAWGKEMQRSGPPVRQPVASRTDVFERLDTARYGSEDAPLNDSYVIA